MDAPSTDGLWHARPGPAKFARVPELPDVAVFKRYLDATALHHRITHVETPGEQILEETRASDLRTALRGRAFAASHRHGKYLFVSLEDAGQEGGDSAQAPPHLLVHFGMTGFWDYSQDGYGAEDGQDPLHARAVLFFANEYRLSYVNKRRLGRLGIVADIQTYLTDHDIGPDAERMSQEAFFEALDRGRGSLKSTLMNQKLIAGIGNVYSDEILFQAGIHPRTPADEVSSSTRGELYRVMHTVFTEVIDAGASPSALPGGYLVPHREAGAACPRCGGTVVKERVAGRSSYVCPVCQPE